MHCITYISIYVLGSGLKIAWDESTMNCRCRNSPWCDFEWNTPGWYSQLDRGIGRLTWEQLQLPKSSWCILGTTHKDDWWFRGLWRNSDPVWIPETSGYFRTSDLPKSILWAMAKGLLWTMASQLPRFDTISASTFGNQFVGRVANPDEAWKMGSGTWAKPCLQTFSKPSSRFKILVVQLGIKRYYIISTEAIYKPVRAFHSPFCCRCYSSTGKLVAGLWVAARQLGRRNYTKDRTFRFAALCLSLSLVFS